jgi:phage terminase large subunit-like protein
MHISELIAKKRQAKKEGWLQYVRNASDEQALLQGCYFDLETAEYVQFFIEKFLKPQKSSIDGKFKLLDYQKQDIIYPLFGWLKENGYRRFTRGYIELPKKNSKSFLASAIGLYMLYADSEDGAEVYCVANNIEQAKIVWIESANMLESSPHLLNQTMQVTRSTYTITKDYNSWFKAWSSEKGGRDGFNIHCAIIDEFHEWVNTYSREVYDKIRYGGIARKQPLCPLIITTAGDDRFSLCYETHEYAKKILSGAQVDTSFFACMYAADETKIKNDPDYWKSKEARIEANPALGTILKDEDFVTDIAECENNPVNKAKFLRYRLNVWTEAENAWIEIDLWNKNKVDFDEKELEGKVCYAGLDLASTDDTTAIVYVFPEKHGDEVKFKILPRIFVPKDTAFERTRKNIAPYGHWISQGHVIATPRDYIDNELVFAQLKKDAQRFKIKEMAYDRYSSDWIISQIQQEMANIELIPFGQGFVDMSSPTNALYIELKKNNILHNGNECMKWQVSNAVAETNATEQIKLVKKISKGKIDAVIALVMAFARAQIAQEKKRKSIYSLENFDEVIKDIEGR